MRFSRSPINHRSTSWRTPFPVPSDTPPCSRSGTRCPRCDTSCREGRGLLFPVRRSVHTVRRLGSETQNELATLIVGILLQRGLGPASDTVGMTSATREPDSISSRRECPRSPALYGAASSSTQNIPLQPLTPTSSISLCRKSASPPIRLMVSTSTPAYVSELSSTDTTASLPSSAAVRGPIVTELRDLTARLRPSKTGVGSTGVQRKKGSPHSVMVERRTKGAEVVEKATIACASPPPSPPS